MSDQDRPSSEGEPQGPRSRPAPAYGEYAPEGWEWKPPAEGGAAPERRDGTAGVPSPHTPGGGAGPLAGVPHNLGSPGSAPGAGTAASRASAQPGARDTDPAPLPGGRPPRLPRPVPPAAQSVAPKRRTGDRVVTIILLVLAAYGTLNSAASFFALEAQLRLTANMIGIDSPEVAPWVGTLGVVSGLAILLLFAITLLWSIQRMRARKLAFWVPLAAGGIAVVLALVIPMIALAGTPEIMQQLESDPSGSLDRMMQYLQSGGME